MARVKLKHFARPDMVSDPEWEQAMEVSVKYVEKKINRLNHCGALDEGVFAIPTAEHFVFGAFDKLFTGEWEWSPHRAIHTQLVKIALSDISHHLRDWKKKEHVEVVAFDERIAVEQRQTRTGSINVSCPELTAINLVTYQERAGSITRAATVLAELVEKIDFGRLSPEFVKVAPVACFQRLGYILEEVLEEQEAADAVFGLLKRTGVRLQTAALKAGKPADGCERNERWKIYVNETIEIDEL